MRCATLEPPPRHSAQEADRADESGPVWMEEFVSALPAMLTPKQVAEALCISARTARELCASGSLDGAFKLGSTWRVPRGAIAQLIESGGIRCGSIRDMERGNRP